MPKLDSPIAGDSVDDECSESDCSYHQKLYETYVRVVEIDGIPADSLRPKLVEALDKHFKKFEGECDLERGTVCPRGCYCFISERKLKSKNGYSQATLTRVTAKLTIAEVVRSVTVEFHIRQRTLWSKCRTAIEIAVV